MPGSFLHKKNKLNKEIREESKQAPSASFNSLLYGTIITFKIKIQENTVILTKNPVRLKNGQCER